MVGVVSIRMDRLRDRIMGYKIDFKEKCQNSDLLPAKGLIDIESITKLGKPYFDP